MIKVILWDLDGTLLDFVTAERNALISCFEKFGLGVCTVQAAARYSSINVKHWKAMERGEITKEQVMIKRFEEFFRTENIAFTDYAAFDNEYHFRLCDTILFLDNSFELVKSLQGRVKQYLVSNGTLFAQTIRLAKSGLDKLLDSTFVSENIGFNKPSIEFFNAVFTSIGNYSKNEILIVGDSLTSDIVGGNNAGIKCCWYNPSCRKQDIEAKIDYEITNLNEIIDILDNEEEQ